jgi:GH35 family endo-1,4-beta-xylanase
MTGSNSPKWLSQRDFFKLGSVVSLALLLAACSPAPTPPPTAAPTATPIPLPTATLRPTATPTAAPTATPEPTKTPTPEPTIPLGGVSVNYPRQMLVIRAYEKFKLGDAVDSKQLKFEVRQNLNDPNKTPIVFGRDPKTNEIILATRLDQQTKELKWNVAGLRDLADAVGIRIGTNLSSPFHSSSKIAAHDRIVLQEFNHATIDHFFMVVMAPESGTFNFSGAEKAIALAKANGMTVGSEPLLYGGTDCEKTFLKKYWDLAEQSGFRKAIQKLTYDQVKLMEDNPEQGNRLIETIIDGLPDPQMREQMKTARKEVRNYVVDYVKAVVGRFRGKVDIWKVVNEFDINPKWNPTDTIDPYFWMIGPDYPDIAFQAVRETDPNAYTMFSSLNIGEPGTPLQRQWSIGITAPVIERLKQKGLINAVGDQGHEDASQPFDWKERLAYEQKIYGIDIIITERDVDLRNLSGDVSQRYERQAELYAASFQAALDAGVKYFTFWECFGDSDSWLERVPGIGSPNADPTLFYDDGTPKPAYFAVRQVLLERLARK